MSIVSRTADQLIFIVSGPAGSGKTTLVTRLVAELPSIVKSISCTTRKPRPGEQGGKDYFFLTRQAFQERLHLGEFLEHVHIFGHDYGTSKEFVLEQQRQGKDVVLIIDTQGALQVQKILSKRAIFIFIIPPSFIILKERLLQREGKENVEDVDARMTQAYREVEMISHYDYHVVNDRLDSAYDVLKSIFIAERHRIRRELGV